MESPTTNQDLTLTQFLFDLSTNPQLQIKLAHLYEEALHKFFADQGLSDENVQLLTNAYLSDDGKKKLAQKLNTIEKNCWNCHPPTYTPD